MRRLKKARPRRSSSGALEVSDCTLRFAHLVPFCLPLDSLQLLDTLVSDGYAIAERTPGREPKYRYIERPRRKTVFSDVPCFTCPVCNNSVISESSQCRETMGVPAVICSRFSLSRSRPSASKLKPLPLTCRCVIDVRRAA